MAIWQRRHGALAGAALVVSTLCAAQQPASPDSSTSPTPPPATAEQKSALDPRATALFKRMSDYLGSQKAFSVRTRSISEAVLASGQKLQFEARSDLSVQRPNHLRSTRSGEKSDIDFYYDGSTATVFGQRNRYYASTKAPPTLDAMMDDVRARLDMDPPAADLLYADVYGGLMPDVTQALYVGAARLGDVMTHHLAFRAPDVDWQIWITDGDRPVPRKYVVTTTNVAGAPEFSVEFSDWNFAPRFTASTFKFSPPAGAQKIDFLPRGKTEPAR